MTTARAFVDVCLTQSGDPYVFGAEAPPSDPDPDAFDCSELVEWGLRRLGVRFPDGAINQYHACRNARTLVPLLEGFGTFGALLFRIGTSPNHVAISLGDGRSFEARGRAYGVGTFGGVASRRWTHAGLIPGVTYTAADDRPPIVPRPRAQEEETVATVLYPEGGGPSWLLTNDGKRIQLTKWDDILRGIESGACFLAEAKADQIGKIPMVAA